MKKLLTALALVAGVVWLGANSVSATWQPCEEVSIDYLVETYKPKPCPTTTTIPETTIPETTVPETTVPETTVPETTVVETTVAETTVPAVVSPQAVATTTPAASAPASQSLPATGSENWSIAIAATLFLLLGGSVLLIARRTD